MYSPFGSSNLEIGYLDIRTVRTVHLDFGDLGFSELYFAYIPFGNCNLDIGNLDFVDLGFSELYFAYIPFGNCNLDIGNFYFVIQSHRIFEFGNLDTCTSRTVPSEIGFVKLEVSEFVFSVQSEPNQCTLMDVAGGIDRYRLGLIPTVPEASNWDFHILCPRC